MKSTVRIQLPALLLCIIASCLGFFLRLQQLHTERRADGTVTMGSFGLALLLLCALFLLAILCLLLLSRKRPGDSSVFSSHPAAATIRLLAALLLLLGNLLRWDTSAHLSDRLLILLGIAAAVCVVLFSLRCLKRQTPSPLLYMLVGLYLALHLILSFKNWNTDPAVQDYCYALIAILCTMLSMTQLAGFCFGRGKPCLPLFWTLGSFLFCAISLADGVAARDTASLCMYGSLLLLSALHSAELLRAGRRDA